jgi:hypothetical protein
MRERYALRRAMTVSRFFNTPITGEHASGAVRKRLAILLAAIAVPALAAPGDFGRLPGSAATEAELSRASGSSGSSLAFAMEFERPGMNFPGSAFYFLADPPSDALIALPASDAWQAGEGEAGRDVGAMIAAGPAARPFFSAAGVGHSQALECLAQAIWYEAASESSAGQRAVAQVVLNRVTHPAWPPSVCGVVYQGSERRTGCQFTFTCDGSLSPRASGASWARAQRIAAEALSGNVYQPIGHATHYHTLWVNPRWAGSLDHIGTIGAHRFYRNRGATGEKAAFTVRYAGFEPHIAKVRTAPVLAAEVSAVPPSPLPGKRAASAAPAVGAPTPSSTPAPVIADPAYASVGQVRGDYAAAGQWKSGAARAALENDRRKLALAGGGMQQETSNPQE